MRGPTLLVLASALLASASAWADPLTCNDGTTGVEVASPDAVHVGVPGVAGATVTLGSADGVAAVCNPTGPHVSVTPTVHVVTEDPVVDTVVAIAQPVVEQVLGLVPPVPPLPL